MCACVGGGEGGGGGRGRKREDGRFQKRADTRTSYSSGYVFGTKPIYKFVSVFFSLSGLVCKLLDTLEQKHVGDLCPVC